MDVGENGKLIVLLYIDEEENETDICMRGDVLSGLWITFFVFLCLLLLPFIHCYGCRPPTSHDYDEDDDSDAELMQTESYEIVILSLCVARNM